MHKGSFTIYVYKLRWVGGWWNVNECKRGVGRSSDKCKHLKRNSETNITIRRQNRLISGALRKVTYEANFCNKIKIFRPYSLNDQIESTLVSILKIGP